MDGINVSEYKRGLLGFGVGMCSTDCRSTYQYQCLDPLDLHQVFQTVVTTMTDMYIVFVFYIWTLSLSVKIL